MKPNSKFKSWSNKKFNVHCTTHAPRLQFGQLDKSRADVMSWIEWVSKTSLELSKTVKEKVALV